jgi:hypothetical protein
MSVSWALQKRLQSIEHAEGQTRSIQHGKRGVKLVGSKDSLEKWAKTENKEPDLIFREEEGWDEE